MTTSNQTMGRSGEQIAALFLEEKGYTVVERNWRCKAGELDLVLRKGAEWRFVEVKTRSSDRFGRPEESVTPRKKGHFHQAIEWYVMDRNIAPKDIHADVLAITMNERKFDVRWLPDVT